MTTLNLLLRTSICSVKRGYDKNMRLKNNEIKSIVVAAVKFLAIDINTNAHRTLVVN